MTAQQIVDFLNLALQVDGPAIRSLFLLEVAANAAIADHPTILVLMRDGRPFLRPLGLLNGIAALDGQQIEAVYREVGGPLQYFRLQEVSESP